MEKIIATRIEPIYKKYNDQSLKAEYATKHGINGVFFGVSNWSKGTPLHDFFNQDGTKKSGFYNTKYSGWGDHFQDVSLTLKTLLSPSTKDSHKKNPPKEIIEWKKRKIITGLSVKRNLNLSQYNSYYYRNLSKNTYSIACVKKTMLEKQYEYTYTGSLISDKNYWSEFQLFADPSDVSNHFINDIDFQNLDFNLEADEDLVFINNLWIYPSTHYVGATLNQDLGGMGIALIEHTSVEVIIKYKSSYF